MRIPKRTADWGMDVAELLTADSSCDVKPIFEDGLRRRWIQLAVKEISQALRHYEIDGQEINQWCGDGAPFSQHGSWFVARRGSFVGRGVRVVRGSQKSETNARRLFHALRVSFRLGSVALVDPDLKISEYASEATRRALNELTNVVLGFHLPLLAELDAAFKGLQLGRLHELNQARVRLVSLLSLETSGHASET